MNTEEAPKIFVGNAEITPTCFDITLDMTEILKQTSYYRKASTGVSYLDIKLLPFRKGTNKFGKTHYAIIKNKKRKDEI